MDNTVADENEIDKKEIVESKSENAVAKLAKEVDSDTAVVVVCYLKKEALAMHDLAVDLSGVND